MDADYALLKPWFLLLYGLFGMTILALATAPGHRIVARACHGVEAKVIGLVLAALAAMLLLLRYVCTGSALIVGATVIAGIVFALQPGNRTIARLIGGVAAAVIVLSLAWWQIDGNAVALLPLMAFAIVLASLCLGFHHRGRVETLSIAAPVAVFLIAGMALMLDLGAYRPGTTALRMLVHHWGAYIGPALQVKAGLVPLYDIPVQYGLGPTLAIAATCGTSANACWSGAHVIFTGMTLASGLLVLLMVLAGRHRGWAWSSVVTIVVFAAVFLWPGFPIFGNILAATPSGDGIRFLPVTLVATLLFFGAPKFAAAAMVPTVLWSPESAAMAVTVFGLCETARLGFIRTAFLTAALLGGSYTALLLVHRLVYDVFIDPTVLVEYVLHVPGQLPIDPFSDIMVLAAVLGLGGWLVFRTAATPDEARRDRAATVLLFAVASYCLGRSHHNNICVLAPFLALVAFRVLERTEPEHDTIRRVVAFGLAVSVAALALSSWRYRPYDPDVILGVDDVLAGFDSVEPDIARFRAQIPGAGGLGIADFGPAYIRHPSETVMWTPMDPSSLWSYVPSPRRQLYIQRGATRLRRAGWGLFIEHQFFLYDDLLSSYTASNEQSFEGAPTEPGGPPTHFKVACFTPKPQVATLSSPGCPPP